MRSSFNATTDRCLLIGYHVQAADQLRELLGDGPNGLQAEADHDGPFQCVSSRRQTCG